MLKKITQTLNESAKELTTINKKTDVLMKYERLEKLLTQTETENRRECKYRLSDKTLQLIENRKHILVKNPKKL